MRRLKLYHALPALIIFMAPPIATAQSSEPLSGLFACEALTDTDAALACVRSETAKLCGTCVTTPPIGSGKQSGTESQSAVQNPTLDSSEKFIPLKRDETPKKRTLTIKSAQTYGGNGYIRFTLENGEIWHQTDRGNLRLGRSNSPDKLTIKKARWGASGPA